LESKLGTPKENRTALKHKKNALDEKNEDVTILQIFFAQVKSDWRDTNDHRFSVIEWAPKISIGVGEPNYTRDIATFAVDGEKLENFERNIVDLGALCSISPLQSNLTY
jgi:hypothetical protein